MVVVIVSVSYAEYPGFAKHTMMRATNPNEGRKLANRDDGDFVTPSIVN
jgi:hypothetical protein